MLNCENGSNVQVVLMSLFEHPKCLPSHYANLTSPHPTPPHPHIYTSDSFLLHQTPFLPVYQVQKQHNDS